MSAQKTQTKIDNLARAVSRFNEALEQGPATELEMDGSLQRFEFTFELCWKAMRQVLEDEGLRYGTPREVLQGALQAGWLDNEHVWLEMLRDRNLASHIYSQDLALAIYERLENYSSHLTRMSQLLMHRASSNKENPADEVD